MGEEERESSKGDIEGCEGGRGMGMEREVGALVDEKVGVNRVEMKWRKMERGERN